MTQRQRGHGEVGIQHSEDRSQSGNQNCRPEQRHPERSGVASGRSAFHFDSWLLLSVSPCLLLGGPLPMNLKIALLPGDGIGPEVTAQAVAVLEAVCRKFSHTLEAKSGLIGGVAIRATGDPLPAETLALAKSAAAVLMGAVGHPEFDSLPPEKKPEKGLLGIRKELHVFA